VLIDIIALAGAAAVVEGLREVYSPAAWIVTGAVLFLCSWRISRAEAVSP